MEAIWSHKSTRSLRARMYTHTRRIKKTGVQKQRLTGDFGETGDSVVGSRVLWLLTVHLLGCFPQLHPLTQPSQCAHWHRRPDMQIHCPHWCFPEKSSRVRFQSLHCATVRCFSCCCVTPVFPAGWTTGSWRGEAGALLKGALSGASVCRSLYLKGKGAVVHILCIHCNLVHFKCCVPT